MQIRKNTIENLRKNPKVDVLIIGAGINGAGLFRELALQGIECILIDKADFMSGASAAPSRMIHGGLRYLENREVRLVKESLTERNLLLQNAPHYVRPLPTMIPIYHWFSGVVNGIRKFFGMKATSTPRGAVIVKLGLLMYDIFTRKQRVMPSHKFTNKQQSLSHRPLLDPKIVCTALFYDAWISYPERLGIELIQDGLRLMSGSKVLNYVSLNGIKKGEVLLKDELSKEQLVVQPRLMVNATGAWIDLANAALGIKTKLIGGTKGSHLMVDNQILLNEIDGQMVYYENDEGRICILFPLHGKVMVGSTDIKISNPEEAICTDEEVAYMLGCVRQVFPKLEIDASHIVFRYSGVRPLPYSDGSLKNAQISRDHQIEIIEPSIGFPFPILNLIGGKWTTFRAFGEQTATIVLKQLEKPVKVSSRNTPIGGGKDFPATDEEKDKWVLNLKKKTELNTERIQTLLFRYGTKAEIIAKYTTLNPDRFLIHNQYYSQREIEYLIHEEFVIHLDDLLLRRTVIALSGQLTYELLIELAEILRNCLQYTDQEKNNEITRTRHILETKHGIKFK